LEGSKKASRDLRALMEGNYFDNPKPVGLLKRLIQIVPDVSEDSIFLDFFAGSGTLAQAVLEANEGGGAGKFILVQLPESTRTLNKDGTYSESLAYKAGYHTIADITKDRVRRVIQKQKTPNKDKAKPGELFEENKERFADLGFRSFRLADSNFKVWDSGAPTNTTTLGEQLSLHIQHVQKDRTSADILYEILLRSGFPLTAPVETLQVAGKSAFAVADGAMLVCLEHELTLDVIRAMAEKKPERVVCLDEGFADNDQLKTNAVQTFRAKGIVFRTV
jgi:adenine-specific DNA-methyltransferase